MLIRAMVFGMAIAVSISAYASEALIYAAVYECNAKAINREMVQICSTWFPKIASHGADAYRMWLARNLAKADSTEIACEQELLAKVASNSQLEVDAVRKKMADLQLEIKTNFQSRVQTEGESACNEVLRQLETGSGGIDIE